MALLRLSGSDMVELTSFDDFKQPPRAPWIILAIVAVVIGVFLLLRALPGRESGEKKKGDRPAATNTNAVAVSDGGTTKHALPTMPPKPDRELGPDALLRLAELVSKAEEMEKAGKLPQARDLYLDAWDMAPAGEARRKIEQPLARINTELVTKPWRMKEKVLHKVEPRDQLRLLARKYGTTIDLIVRSNNIKDPNAIRAGHDEFLILNAKFKLVVNKTRNDMIVYMNDRFFKRYLVGTGKFDQTPPGTFETLSRDKFPVWWKNGRRIEYTGDPKGENILGTRWMSIRATGSTAPIEHLGIHGTWNNASIGKSESAGCIRMRNEDVEEIFDLVPIHTPVIVEE